MLYFVENLHILPYCLDFKNITFNHSVKNNQETCNVIDTVSLIY